MTAIDGAIQKALATIRQHMLDRGWTVATAESLTAGMIASELASQPGSSTYLRGGIVAYTLDAKVALLGVTRAAAQACNCVSIDVAVEMARSAQRQFGADCVIAVTGYAEVWGEDAKKEPMAYYAIICDSCLSVGTIRGGTRTRNEMRQWVMATTLTSLAGLLEVSP